MTTRNGGAAVVETLAAHGVDTVFGVPGTHNLELYRHLGPCGIRAVTPRHEQVASLVLHESSVSHPQRLASKSRSLNCSSGSHCWQRPAAALC